jgi:hypothetical protein
VTTVPGMSSADAQRPWCAPRRSERTEPVFPGMVRRGQGDVHADSTVGGFCTAVPGRAARMRSARSTERMRQSAASRGGRGATTEQAGDVDRDDVVGGFRAWHRSAAVDGCTGRTPGRRGHSSSGPGERATGLRGSRGASRRGHADRGRGPGKQSQAATVSQPNATSGLMGGPPRGASNRPRDECGPRNTGHLW